MNTIEYEFFIGKHVNEFSVINELKRERKTNFNKYYMFSKKGKIFCGKTFNHLTIKTNNQEIIEDITLYFPVILDKTFYSSLTNRYGLPSQIRVADTITRSGKVHKDELVSYSMDQTTSLKEGNFDDKPIIVLWEKEDYQIRLFFKYEINVSEIEYSLPKH